MQRLNNTALKPIRIGSIGMLKNYQINMGTFILVTFQKCHNLTLLALFKYQHLHQHAHQPIDL